MEQSLVRGCLVLKREPLCRIGAVRLASFLLVLSFLLDPAVGHGASGAAAPREGWSWLVEPMALSRSLSLDAE